MKIYTFISFVLLVLLSLIPPIEIVLRNPQYPYWLWMVLTAGFFGIYIIFVKTSIFVKIIAIAGFINCFFSAAPYISFTSYCSLILCCYFYICASRIEDWKIVLRAAQCILFLNTILLILEFFNKDSLMDFGEVYVQNFGVLGHHMQMGSFAIVITALLLTFSKLNIIFPILVAIFCKSSWTFLCAGIGVSIYTYSINKNLTAMVIIGFLFVFCVWDITNHKIEINTGSSDSARLTVWERSFALASKHPFVGWGIGTYKNLFPPLSRLKCIPYKTAHNFIAELVFEVGFPLTICLLFSLGCLFMALFNKEQWLLLSGLGMITTDALVHFPDRMIQCVPLIILFLAYCAFKLRRVEPCHLH